MARSANGSDRAAADCELGPVLRERGSLRLLDVGSQRGWALINRVPPRQLFQPRLSPGAFLLVHPPDPV